MRLRHTLTVLLVLATIVPVAGLGMWTRQHLLEAQFEDVADRHLLLAKNLEQALSRYYRDLVSGFEMLAGAGARLNHGAGYDHLASNLGFRHLCSFRVSDGALVAATGFEAPHCGDYLDDTRFAELLSHARDGETLITPIIKTPEGRNRLNVVRLKGDRLCLGSVETSYFISLGRSIKFGKQGHSAIVDQAGNVLAHPLDSWIAEAKNIYQVSAVQRMMAGETGIDRFYSPALKGDMIAGFTQVSGAGWGVMVPQPVAELEAAAAQAHQPIGTITFFSALAALVLAVAFSQRIAYPLEKITQAARRGQAEGRLHGAEIDPKLLLLEEHHSIVNSYNAMVRSAEEAHGSMRSLAYTDPLTGLLNRSAFGFLADLDFDKCRTEHQCGSLLYFDLDNFKAINDQHGHACGDVVLKSVSERVTALLKAEFGSELIARAADVTEGLKDSCRPFAARIGGDEFAVFLPGIGDVEAVRAFAARLATAISKPISWNDITLVAATSVGAVCLPGNVRDLDQALHRADVALYHAKMQNKGGCCVFDEEDGMSSLSETRETISAAIDRGEMELYYQPKVESTTGAVKSVEALVRWNSPQRGIVQPLDFIPHIEQSSVVNKLGEWVLKNAARDAARWRDEGRDLRVAVNIGARHFLDAGFADSVFSIIEDAGIAPDLIELEITEEASMFQDSEGAAVIGTLKAGGVRISLDDYGRGYSNLNRLAGLHVDTIKIDRGLIADAVVSERTRQIVIATTRMAEALNCRIVAEGIETTGHAALMRRLGCHELQGYLFAKPLQRAEFEAWLEARETNAVIDLQKRIVQAV